MQAYARLRCDIEPERRRDIAARAFVFAALTPRADQYGRWIHVGNSGTRADASEMAAKTTNDMCEKVEKCVKVIDTMENLTRQTAGF